jgi:hypothetical protein
MFLDFPDPDPSLFVLIQIRILLSSSRNSRENLDFYCFVTSLRILSLKDDVNVPVPSNSDEQKQQFWHLEGR